MANPVVAVLDSDREALHTGRIVPIYPQIGKVKPFELIDWMANALSRARPIPDPVPDVVLAANGLLSRDEAYAGIHFPDTLDQTRPARQRLAYDELLRLEVALALRKRKQTEEATGFAHDPSGELAAAFLGGLPYELTAAQERVIDEILGDLREGHPMHRLLHGEVGSGKTVVAVVTLLNGVEGDGKVRSWPRPRSSPCSIIWGSPVCWPRPGSHRSPSSLQRPRHAEFFGSDGPAVHIGILTGSTAAANYNPDISRADLLKDVAKGQVDILVGTHALIQEE